jgi:hypothetical protein
MARAARLSQCGGREEKEWRAEIVDCGWWIVDCGWEEESFRPINDPRSTISDPRSGFRASEWFFRVMRGWDGVEAEFFGRRDWTCDELFDGLEDELELLVVVGVLFLEGFDFLGQERIGIHQPP